MVTTYYWKKEYSHKYAKCYKNILQVDIFKIEKMWDIYFQDRCALIENGVK